jgi:urease accessory protein
VGLLAGALAQARPRAIAKKMARRWARVPERTAKKMTRDMTDWRLWQIVDSAFPTGGFAHSWGLESAWQHGEVRDAGALRRFAGQTIVQAGRGVMPFVTAAHRAPDRLAALDALADAFLTNVVANRASRVQGRTLAASVRRVWPSPATEAVERCALAGCAHVAPVTGAALAAIGVPLDAVQHLVLFVAARGVLSSAVRLGLVGSYEAQRLTDDCAAEATDVWRTCRHLEADDIAQTAPVIDLWQAAHDRLYSRLFQS